MTRTILQRVADRDAAAMQECTTRYGGLVWSLARRHAPSPSDAEDAVQEIFVALWQSAGRFDPEVASETTFVAMIARRRLIDRRRRAQRQPRTESLMDSTPLPTVEQKDMVEVEDQADRVKQALAELRPQQRQVLEMALLGGSTQTEIAERLDLPLGTVKSLARRGLIKVRGMLRASEESVDDVEEGQR